MHQADQFEPARDRDRHVIDDDALRGDGDRLQARAAEPVDRHGRGGDGDAGAERRLARDVAAGGAFGQRAAHHDILDRGGIDAGAGDGVADDVAAQLGAVGDVEGAAPGPADGRACGRNDDGVRHWLLLNLCGGRGGTALFLGQFLVRQLADRGSRQAHTELGRGGQFVTPERVGEKAAQV